MYGNKLRNYRIYKNTFGKEDYLNILTYKPFRSNIAQLRLSCHKLHIEVGRYAKPEERLLPSERLCKYCPLNKCEDEEHFVMNCELYMSERTNMLNKMENLFPHITNYTKDKLYIWLMANLNEEVILTLAKYVTSNFKQRKETKLV